MTRKLSPLLAGLAVLVALGLWLPLIGAEPKTGPGQDKNPPDSAAQNFAIEHEIGHRFHIDPSDLPEPKTGPIVTNRVLIIPYTGQVPAVPPGFTATPFAVGLVNPRRLLVLPNGDVLVAEQSTGYLTLLRDDGEGRAGWIDRHVEDLNKPYGLAWRGDELLVADLEAIWRVPHVVGALRAGRPVAAQKVGDVPPEQRKPVDGAYGAQLLTKKGVFGIVQGHQNRGLAIDPKTGALFVGVGSSGNLGVEPEPKATIQRFDPDGSNQTTYASGTRNATALAFHPTTGELWALVQERDGLGDNLPSDYLIRVQQGGFYGWPYAYIGKHPQPGFAQLAPDKVPAEYKGSLFVALKGSWNRSLPTGYKIVRVPFKDGRPEGYYENFATGFWASGEQRAEVFGRPAALAIAKDGALLVADDANGTIWRIAYTGKK
jgi:glucose/arabinose dehydrogenase